MTRIAKEKEQLAVESRRWLEERITSGDTLYMVVRNVSKSGTTKVISPIIWHRGIVLHIGYHVANALGQPFVEETSGVRMRGAGLSLTQEMTHALGIALFDDGYALHCREL